MSLAVLYGILVLGLYWHFRWALLNSHNDAGTPGPVATAIRGVIVAAVTLASAALAGGSDGIAGVVLWMFAVGLALGSSLTPPPRATDLGGPNTYGEQLYERIAVSVLLEHPLQHAGPVRPDERVVVRRSDGESAAEAFHGVQQAGCVFPERARGEIPGHAGRQPGLSRRL